MAAAVEEDMSPSRVLLVNPPLLLDREFIDYPYFTGFGVVSNAAALRARGFSVEVADAQARASSGVETALDGRLLAGCGIDELFAGVTREPDAVVVAVPPFLLPHVRTAFATALFAAVRARFPAARLVAADLYFGGMHYLEYDGARFLRRHPELDALVKYEGEGALPELLSTPPEARPVVRRGLARELEPDSIPFPAWDLIDTRLHRAFLARFFRAAGRPNPYDDGVALLPAVTSRGCAYRCGFCTSNPGEASPAFRPHGTAYLKELFSELKTKHGAGRLVLLDACANQDSRRFEELLDLVGSLGLRCEFPNGLRADKLTLAALKTLKRLSGAVTISAESADREVLSRRVKKGLEPGAVERVADWCRRLGLPLSIHYVVGFPGESVATVNRTLAHALSMKEERGATPLVQNFVSLPGTPMHGTCVAEGLLEGFDAERLYPHFQGEPAIDLPGLSAARLSGMRRLFERRLNATTTKKVIVNLTYHCNNSCRFCAIGDRDKRHGDLTRYVELLKEYRRRGVGALDLDGGEPTLYPGFFALVSAAKKLGYGPITVTTNGRRLADRSFASRFLLSGITDVLVSLHGHEAGVHERLTRRAGSFAETVEGLRHALRLKPKRVSLGVNIVLTRENAPTASEFFEFVHGLGIEKVNVQLVTPFGLAAASPGEDDETLLGQLAPAVASWGSRLRIELVNALPCRSKGLPAAPPELGKHSRDMVFVDAEPENLASYLDAKRRKDEDCLSCEHSIGCAGFYVFAEGKAEPVARGATAR
jgi:MoaA/NifB/PqqE/SkfB family radical SAM enzyme